MEERKLICVCMRACVGIRAGRISNRQRPVGITTSRALRRRGDIMYTKNSDTNNGSNDTIAKKIQGSKENDDLAQIGRGFMGTFGGIFVETQ